MTHRAPFNLYIASCEKTGGIYHYRINVNEQEKAKLMGFTPMDRPMYMTVANGKMYVLLRAPFANGESGLAVYDIDSEGRLIDTSKIDSTKGKVACHLTVDGDRVFIVNYISGSVINMPDRLVTHSGRGVHPQRQRSPHTHFVSVTPDGKFLCVTDLGVDKIFIYHKDLTLASTVDIPLGHGPRHLAFHKDGTHVFCANELTSTVSLLKYQNGSMEMINTVSVLPEGFDGQSAAAAIRCVGNTVYVSNRGHDSISVLDFVGHHLCLKKTLPSHGKNPRDFVAYYDWLVVANELSNEVTLISVEKEHLVESITVSSPVCLVAIQ